MRGIINEPLYQKLLSYKKCLLFDEYHTIPVEKLLGKGSMIQVLNEKNEVIYESKYGIAPERYTKSELDCIPFYDELKRISVKSIHSWGVKTKDKQKVLIVENLNNNSSETYLMDSANHLLNSTNINGKTSFTDRELGYMTGTFPGNIWIQKHEFKNKNGQFRTLLICLPVISDTEYKQAYQELSSFIYIVIIFYFTLIITLVLTLNYQFNKPVKLLNNALLNLAEKKKVSPIEYSGPIEFVKICNSFNIMANRLSQSDTENKRLETEKNKMLADISHDLKTPITVIQGYSKALCDGLIPEESKNQYIDIIYKKSLSMGKLINQFHAYSKLKHPDFKYQFEETDICEYCREYLADKFEELSINGYSLEVNIPETSVYVQMDQEQFKRVLENLLSNTVSHTAEGTHIIFKIICENEQVLIHYEDDGGGISPDIAQYIFEPFVVEDSSRNKNGSGLGLSIVRKIILAHKGNIQLVSPKQDPSVKGDLAVFEIILPRTKK